MISLFQSTRTPRGGATGEGGRIKAQFVISIHAPHEGVRPECDVLLRDDELFQSTHPTRGCDVSCGTALQLWLDISIHAPHEGVRHVCMARPIAPRISIHAPHEGVRLFHFLLLPSDVPFQSTHPTRGCDLGHGKSLVLQQYFNPRTPRGGATYKIPETVTTT